MKEQTPWYVPFTSYMLGKKENRKLDCFFILTIFLVLITVSIIAYVGLKVNSTVSYQEASEFHNFVKSKFEYVSDTVLEDGTAINLEKIPEIVLEYDVKYTEQGIEFSYSLDSEKVISEYYSETGKMPTEYDCQKEMTNNIQMSKNFESISTTSPWASLTQEEYEKEYALQLRSRAVGIGGVFVLIFIVIWFCVFLYAYVATQNCKTKKETFIIMN